LTCQPLNILSFFLHSKVIRYKSGTIFSFSSFLLQLDPKKQPAMQNQTAVALIKPGNLISGHFQIWLAPD
jgi:hypothetical protein